MIEIAPGESKTIELSELGNLKNTDLMIQDESGSNPCQYKVTFSNFKELIKDAKAADEELRSAS